MNVVLTCIGTVIASFFITAFVLECHFQLLIQLRLFTWDFSLCTQLFLVH